MYPVLINLGPIPVHTYGFLIAVGFLASIYVVKRLSLMSKLDVEKMLDLCFWCLLVGFFGARVLYVITQLNYFAQNPLDVFKVWEGGLVFLGGPIAVVPFAAWYVRKHRLPVWKTLDILAPGLVIAHSFGRMGCLAAGCCYGKPTGSDWGIRLYSDLVERGLQGIPLHPTQIYESSALFILFLGLLFLFKRKTFDGQVVLTYFIVYPVVRSIIEIYRGDIVRGFVIDNILSTSQFISILILIAALGTLIVRSRQAPVGKGTSKGKRKSS